jgi:hypothetical protein
MAEAVKLLLTSIAGHADRRKAEVRDMVLEDHRPVGVDDLKIADAALRREKDHDAERAAGVVAVIAARGTRDLTPTPQPIQAAGDSGL